MDIKNYDWPAEFADEFTIADEKIKSWRSKAPAAIKHSDVTMLKGEVITVNGRPFKVWGASIPLFSDKFYPGQSFHFMGDYTD